MACENHINNCSHCVQDMHKAIATNGKHNIPHARKRMRMGPQWIATIKFLPNESIIFFPLPNEFQVQKDSL